MNECRPCAHSHTSFSPRVLQVVLMLAPHTDTTVCDVIAMSNNFTSGSLCRPRFEPAVVEARSEALPPLMQDAVADGSDSVVDLVDSSDEDDDSVSSSVVSIRGVEPARVWLD